jgi:hypothetical protein
MFGQFVVSEMRQCNNPATLIAFKQDVMMAVMRMQGAVTTVLTAVDE